MGVQIGAVGGTRTHMVSRWILSPVRLPVPPQRHIDIKFEIAVFATHTDLVTGKALTSSASSATTAYEYKVFYMNVYILTHFAA